MCGLAAALVARPWWGGEAPVSPDCVCRCDCGDAAEPTVSATAPAAVLPIGLGTAVADGALLCPVLGALSGCPCCAASGLSLQACSRRQAAPKWEVRRPVSLPYSAIDAPRRG